MAEKKDVKSKVSASSKKATNVSAAKKTAPTKARSKPTKKELEAEIERLRKREEQLKLKAIREKEKLLAEKEKELVAREKALTRGAVASEKPVDNNGDDVSEEDSDSPFSFKLQSEKIHHHAHIGDKDVEEDKKEEENVQTRVFEERKVDENVKKSSGGGNVTVTPSDAHEKYKQSRKESFDSVESTGEFAKRLREEKDAFDAEIKAEAEARASGEQDENSGEVSEENLDDAKEFLEKAGKLAEDKSDDEQTEDESSEESSEQDSSDESSDSDNDEEDEEDEEEEEGEIIYEDDDNGSETEGESVDSYSEDITKEEDNENTDNGTITNEEDDIAVPVTTSSEPETSAEESKPVSDSSVEENKPVESVAPVSEPVNSVPETPKETVGKGGGTVQGISLEELRAAMAGEPSKEEKDAMHDTLYKVNEKTGNNLSSDDSRAEELIKKANKKYDKEKKKLPAWLQRKNLKNILIAGGVGLALIGIIVTIIVVFTGKKAPIIPTANYEISVAKSFRTNVSDGDRISLIGTVVTCEYSDGTHEDIEISNENIINSVNNEFEIVSNHILIKDWKTNETSRTIRILIGKDKDSKEAISYIDVTVKKNIMTDIYTLENIDSAMDIDGLPSIVENENLPRFEMFAKYSGLEKDKKLNSDEYILRVVYLKYNETMEQVYQNRNRYDEYLPGEKFVIDKNKAQSGTKIDGAVSWELWAFAIDSDRIIIKNGNNVVACKLESGLFDGNAKLILTEDIYNNIKDTPGYDNYTGVVVNSSSNIVFYKGSSSANPISLNEYYYYGGKIYTDSGKTTELTALTKNAYVVYKLSETDKEVDKLSNVTISGISLYSSYGFDGKTVPNYTNDLAKYLVIGQIQNGRYAGRYVLLGYVSIA